MNANRENENLVGALRQLSVSSRRNKTAQLRDIFDEIEAAKAAGVSNKVIVEELQKNGIFFDVNNFKNARSRILKERALAALQNQSLPETVKPSGTDHVAPREIVKDLVPVPSSLAQTGLASMKIKTLVAQATNKDGNKTSSLEEIKNLSQQEFDVADYQ